MCGVFTSMQSVRRFPGGVGTGRGSPVKRFMGLVTIIALSVSSSLFGRAQEQGTVPVSSAIESAAAVHNDVSPPLRGCPTLNDASVLLAKFLFAHSGPVSRNPLSQTLWFSSPPCLRSPPR